MKLQKLLTIGFLLMISVAALSAQNTLPNPNDDACWSSLDALRACQSQAYNAYMDQAQRCTSYPEYQCLPSDNQTQQKASAKHDNKPASHAITATRTAMAPVAPVDTNSQTATGK